MTSNLGSNTGPFRRGGSLWIGVAYFLVAAVPGFWYPVISVALTERGWSMLIPWVFLTAPVCTLISPLIFAARADRSIAGERVLAASVGGGALFLYLAFEVMDRGGAPWLFLLLLFLNALITAPAWSLLNSVALANLPNPSRQFGLYRVWGTIGWMVAGLIVSGLAIDASALGGKLAAGVRVLAFGSCFLLPHTPPSGIVGKSWSDALGLGAFKILRDRDIAVYFLVALLLAIPSAAQFMYLPKHLSQLGVERVAGAMTVGQVTEIFAMIAMGHLVARGRVKPLFLFALFCGALRYAACAWGTTVSSPMWLLAGVALQGFCWTFFYELGRVVIDRKVARGLRSQAQALLAAVTGGLGGLIGTLGVGALFHGLAPESTSWFPFWVSLTTISAICGVVFMLGYKGGTAPST